MEKGKGKLTVAYAFATAMFDSDSNGYVSVIIRIHNELKLKRIITGQSRGVSPDIIVKWWECSICHSNFEKCNHEEGSLYAGSLCQLIARDIQFTGASFVDEPKDTRCRVNDMLVISEVDKRNLFEWYGFELHDDNVRFKDIAKACKKELISQKIAFKLSRLFSINLYCKTWWYQNTVSDEIKAQDGLDIIVDSKWESLIGNRST